MHLRARLERVLEPHRDMDRVLEFSSGEGLLRWVENHPGELNLIFLDMEMGQLDGMETARRLRQISDRGKSPVGVCHRLYRACL